MKQVYSWHPPKAWANRLKHRVTFEQAAEAMRDVFSVESFDDGEHFGEERFNLLGMYHGVVLHVTYTERNDCIWIISARKAVRDEQDHYYRENSR
jgi:uncharacterized DUF497 family protein